MAADSTVCTLRTSLQSIGENLEKFLSADKEHCTSILSALQEVFEYSKKDEAACKRSIQTCPFESLQFDSKNFDNEVIWQQIQLQNESLLRKIRTGVKPLLNKDNSLWLRGIDVTESEKNQDVLNRYNSFETRGNKGLLNEKEIDDGNDDIDDGNDDIDDGNDDDDIGDDNNNQGTIHKGNKVSKATNSASRVKGSIVDDQFFKLAEMEKFLEGKHGGGDDMSEDESDENGVDYFMDLNNDAENNNEACTAKSSGKAMMYSDYFDAPGDASREVEDDGNVEEDDMLDFESDDDGEDFDKKETGSKLKGLGDDGSDDDAPKSTLEKQQNKVKKQIAALEDSNVSTKPWQLTGETSALARPANSLLEELLQFDHTSAAAPVITEETSLKLEDIILQRIKDSAWDDVERKEKPLKEPYEYKKAQPINQEKSKMSLSEIYEKEYLQQQNPTVEKENEEHAEIKKLMSSLFLKLDALSNFHFTPKPLKSEVTVVANVPSISVEECTPSNVSETALLAPEEIYDKLKREVKSKGEMTKEDRNRERRVKKRKQRLAAKDRAKLQKVLEKTKPGLGNKYTKEKAMERLKKDKSSTIVEEKSRDKHLNSSSGFFDKLQDSVRQEINMKNDRGKNEKKKKTSSAHCRL